MLIAFATLADSIPVFRLARGGNRDDAKAYASL
jgi:hypothetical protein